MKALIASLIIFALLLALITANCIYVNRITNDLLSQAKALGGASDESTVLQLKELKNNFKRHENILLLSQSYISVNKVDDCIDGALAYAESGDDPAFQNAKAILINAIHDLSRLEQLSTRNIL